jgi:hypothetical protein
MIDELATSLNDFSGPANRTRCFTHILNLVVKSILQQFDVPKVKRHKIVDTATEELLELAGDIEGEEWSTTCDLAQAEDKGNNNIEGWVDERNLMNKEELEDLNKVIQPIRFLLTKVRISRYFLFVSIDS